MIIKETLINKMPWVQHIATRIILFFFLLATLFQLPTPYKPIILLSPLALWGGNPHLIASAFYRSRWIFIMISISHWLYSPGMLIWPKNIYSPTWEGLVLCGHALGHLGSIITLYAILIMPLTPQELISGLWTLSKPLQYIGFPCERAIIRLGLIMRYINNIEKNQVLPESISIDEQPWPNSSLWLLSIWSIALLLYILYSALLSLPTIIAI